MSGVRGQSGAAAYLDFEVEVGVGRGREYPVEVRSPAGEARATLRFPFDELALENRLLVVQNVLLRGIGLTRNVTARAPEERTVEAFGRALFEALLPGEALSRYDVCRRMAREQGKGLRLRLQVLDPALAALPWEFLFDPRRGDYVCLSQRTPLVRHLEVAEPVEPLAVAPPLRILGMVASPSDLPALDTARERERMERALAPLRAAGRAELTWLRGQTWMDLQEAMWRGPWHVFHFVGHGGFDPHTGEGHVALADEGGGTYLLEATALGRLLNDHFPLRLAVLNACEGARGSTRDVFSGTAATLVRLGLPAVVAMQYPITDRAAITFAGTFYRAVGAALPVDGAVGAARQAVSLAAPESLEWGTPVLYLRAPDAVLFDLGAHAAGAPDAAGLPTQAQEAPAAAALGGDAAWPGRIPGLEGAIHGSAVNATIEAARAPGARPPPTPGADRPASSVPQAAESATGPGTRAPTLRRGPTAGGDGIPAPVRSVPLGRLLAWWAGGGAVLSAVCLVLGDSFGTPETPVGPGVAVLIGLVWGVVAGAVGGGAVATVAHVSRNPAASGVIGAVAGGVIGFFDGVALEVGMDATAVGLLSGAALGGIGSFWLVARWRRAQA